MCGRYSLASTDPNALRARFPLGESIQIRRRYNVAPGDSVLAVTTDQEGHPRGSELRWGLVPGWSRDPADGHKMINARAETLTERPAYRGAFERFRCLIIADGFYEWQRREHGPKQPYHATSPDHGPFTFAGLWSVWHRGDPDELRTCTIITTPANAEMAVIHDRMPVILSAEQELPWLDPGSPQALLRDLLEDSRSRLLVLRPVSTAVNDAQYDGPDCLLDPPADPQASLFG